MSRHSQTDPGALATVPAHITALGDSAITVSFGGTISRALSDRARTAARALTEAVLAGVTDVVPAHASVTLFYDPLQARGAALMAAVRVIVDELPLAETYDTAGDTRPALVIPVRYDGPDLADVARGTGLEVEEVIARHAARTYHVYMIGFVPGFTYMGDLDPALILPRRASPRTSVPAGSVAIAGIQTAVYPLKTPGGWHVIAHTEARMFDPAREPPSLLAAGDRVRFERVR